MSSRDHYVPKTLAKYLVPVSLDLGCGKAVVKTLMALIPSDPIRQSHLGRRWHRRNKFCNLCKCADDRRRLEEAAVGNIVYCGQGRNWTTLGLHGTTWNYMELHGTTWK